ncbi:hypothetical protein KL920_001568 [Ogataea angusta]|nr:hypothetical protein KL920_001568 [Ogataea angusta]
MGFLDTHSYTAVTTLANRTIESSPIDSDDACMEMELPELLEAIRLQRNSLEPGPVEVARAIRKKLKYGSFKEQFNALKLLELLVANGGPELNQLYNDSKLLDRLKYTIVTRPEVSGVDPRIRKRATQLAVGWRNEHARTGNAGGLFSLASSASVARAVRPKRKVPDFMNDEADETPFEEVYETPDEESDDSSQNRRHGSSRTASRLVASMTNRELDKKYRIPQINYEKETPKIYQTIAEANVLSTTLTNTLKTLEPDELSIHSAKANRDFDNCRAIRRKILRYLQLVNKEELLGALLKCNDDLVRSLKLYEEMAEPRDGGETDSLADYETINSERRESSVAPATDTSQTYRSEINEFDPFSDHNEVAVPAEWK